MLLQDTRTLLQFQIFWKQKNLTLYFRLNDPLQMLIKTDIYIYVIIHTIPFKKPWFAVVPHCRTTTAYHNLHTTGSKFLFFRQFSCFILFFTFLHFFFPILCISTHLSHDTHSFNFIGYHYISSQQK